MNIFRHSILLILFGLLSSFGLVTTSVAGEVAVTEPDPEYTVIEGSWQRTDGGYVFRISDVQPDGLVRVEYFNPRPIHVAQAVVSTQKELVKLFVKFQDRGYEGSTYTLYYYAEKDALAGYYYQAASNKTYEVIFLRKSGQ